MGPLGGEQVNLDRIVIFAFATGLLLIGAFLISRNWGYHFVAIFLVSGILLGAFGVYANRNIRMYLLIVLVATSLSFYSFEFVYQFLVSAKEDGQMIADARVDYLVAKKEGRPSFLVNPDADVDKNYAQLGIVPVADFPNNIMSCGEAPPRLVRSLDSQGFRNPAGIWGNSRWDIAAIGDSFAQGYCVPDGKDMVSLIRDVYPTTTNLGNFASHPLREFATLKEYAPAHEPKLVIWFFYEGNDFSQSVSHRADLFLRYLREPGFTQNLVERGPELLAVAPKFDSSDQLVSQLMEQAGFAVSPNLASRLRALSENDIQRINEVSFARHSRQTARLDLSLALKLTEVRRRLGLAGHARSNVEFPLVANITDEDFNLLAEIMRNSRDLIGTWDGTMLFVYLPHVRRYFSRSISATYDPVRTRLFDTLAELGIPYIDMDSTFVGRDNLQELWAYGRRGGHFSEEGYEVVANAVLARAATILSPPRTR